MQAIGTVVISQNTVRNVTRQNETPVTIVTPEIIVIPVTRVTVRERNVDSAVPTARTDTTARMRTDDDKRLKAYEEYGWKCNIIISK